MEIYHYINKRDWNKIKNSGGVLKGNADPFWASKILGIPINIINFEHFCSKEVLEIDKTQKYLVGIPKGDIGKWEKSRLLELLKRSKPSKNYRLLIEIKRPEYCFVREHYYKPKETFKPKLSEEEVDKLIRIIENSPPSLKEKLPSFAKTNLEELPILIIFDILSILYYESTTPLAQYELLKEKFRLPEVWVGYEIPLEDVVEEGQA